MSLRHQFLENPQASRDVSTGTQLVPSGNPIGIPPDYLYPNGTLQSNGKSHMPLIGIQYPPKGIPWESYGDPSGIPVRNNQGIPILIPLEPHTYNNPSGTPIPHGNPKGMSWEPHAAHVRALWKWQNESLKSPFLKLTKYLHKDTWGAPYSEGIPNPCHGDSHRHPMGYPVGYTGAPAVFKFMTWLILRPKDSWGFLRIIRIPKDSEGLVGFPRILRIPGDCLGFLRIPVGS